MAMCVRACCHSCEVLETSTGNPRGRDDIGKWMYKEKSRPKNKLKGTCSSMLFIAVTLVKNISGARVKKGAKSFKT